MLEDLLSQGAAFRTHYDTLFLSPNVSQAGVKNEIWKRYKPLDQKAKTGDRSAEQRLIELGEIRRFMENPFRREAYDHGADVLLFAFQDLGASSQCASPQERFAWIEEILAREGCPSFRTAYTDLEKEEFPEDVERVLSFVRK